MRLTIALFAIASLASTIAAQEVFPVNEQESLICWDNVLLKHNDLCMGYSLADMYHQAGKRNVIVASKDSPIKSVRRIGCNRIIPTDSSISCQVDCVFEPDIFESYNSPDGQPCADTGATPTGKCKEGVCKL